MTAAIYRAIVLVVFLLVASVAHAQGEPLKLARILPEDLVWAPSPSGFYLARIAGDSTKAGSYAVRVRFPSGLRIQPHSHPDERIVVVLSGTVYFGYGEQFDETAMKALPAGSTWTEPARQPHFAWAKDGEAVIQVSGKGPSGTTQIQSKQ
jgi:quercetin dioxygenase-like cupin family protein